MKKPTHRIAWACAIVAQALALTLSAPAPAGAEPVPAGAKPVLAGAEPAPVEADRATAAAAGRVTVKSGWELARIREYARGDSEIKGEIKPGESWPCSGGCGTVAGGHVHACGASSNQWYAISYYGYVRYVSATCGTTV
ncbi:hypothetical protein [Streptomyces cyaneofuscatus]|uniref:hypothetical protein n=1 Tax=Streptomyces TaxID=1883 RepID=UPI002E108D30|nr:hypothetical protein OG366_35825 [Streptomyces cyaneofuscatus]WTF33488.1 hypothetical protein OG973_00875 [Streptomyces cyaneofuscatus]